MTLFSCHKLFKTSVVKGWKYASKRLILEGLFRLHMPISSRFFPLRFESTVTHINVFKCMIKNVLPSKTNVSQYKLHMYIFKKNSVKNSWKILILRIAIFYLGNVHSVPIGAKREEVSHWPRYILVLRFQLQIKTNLRTLELSTLKETQGFDLS